jgi:hypothetical protein
MVDIPLNPVMVFNATFNNIPVISWRPALVVEEAGENHINMTNDLICNNKDKKEKH